MNISFNRFKLAFYSILAVACTGKYDNPKAINQVDFPYPMYC